MHLPTVRFILANTKLNLNAQIILAGKLSLGYLNFLH